MPGPLSAGVRRHQFVSAHSCVLSCARYIGAWTSRSSKSAERPPLRVAPAPTSRFAAFGGGGGAARPRGAAAPGAGAGAAALGIAGA